MEKNRNRLFILRLFSNFTLLQNRKKGKKETRCERLDGRVSRAETNETNPVATSKELQKR